MLANPDGPGLAGLGFESAIDSDVKAARRFAELQPWRRAPIRAQRARKRAINNTFNHITQPSWRLTRIAYSARSRQLQTVQNQQLFWWRRLVTCTYYSTPAYTSWWYMPVLQTCLYKFKLMPAWGGQGHQQSGKCIYMQNMQNIDLSLFCIFKTGLHIFWHIFCIFCILFCMFFVIFCILFAYFLLYSAYYFAYLFS